MSRHLTFKPKGEAKQTSCREEAGPPKDTQPASNRTQIQTWIYCVCGF